mgnify:CR=1 FL=1
MADQNCQVIEALEKQWRDALCSRELGRLRELVHPDFLLIARTDAMRTHGYAEGVDRCNRYLEAGADAAMISHRLCAKST